MNTLKKLQLTAPVIGAALLALPVSGFAAFSANPASSSQFTLPRTITATATHRAGATITFRWACTGRGAFSTNVKADSRGVAIARFTPRDGVTAVEQACRTVGQSITLHVRDAGTGSIIGNGLWEISNSNIGPRPPAPAPAQPKRADGKPCNTNSQCSSGACYPGPSLTPGANTPKYCVNRRRNCAQPYRTGAYYGASMIINGRQLRCVNPAKFGWGRLPAQFMLPQGPGTPIAKKVDGAQCNAASDCQSGYCTPGPSMWPNPQGKKYCLNKSLNCSLPNRHGAAYGKTISTYLGTLQCVNPAKLGYGRLPAQFMKPVPLAKR